MRSTVVASLLVLLPASGARAECRSVPECVLNLGMGKLDPKLSAIVGGVGAAVIAVGAIATTAKLLRERPLPEGVVATPGPDGRPRLRLALVPTPAPVATRAPSEASPPTGAFRFNDTATNVVLAVGGAALLTSVILGFVKH